MTKMERCPFCRGKNLVVNEDVSEDLPTVKYAFHVMCRDCHARGRNHYPIGWCETKEAAIQAWNDRGRHILRKGSVIQLDPNKNHRWGGCVLIVDEVREWGVIAYMGMPTEQGPGRAFVRVANDEFVALGVDCEYIADGPGPATEDEYNETREN